MLDALVALSPGRSQPDVWVSPICALAGPALDASMAALDLEGARHRHRHALVLLVLVIASDCVTGAPAPHVTASAAAVSSGDGLCAMSSSNDRLQLPGGGVYFGVNLDWGHDSPASLSGRLGRHPALFVAFAPFPLAASAASYVDGIVGGLVRQHAALMLTLEPNGGLGNVTDGAARALASRLVP